MANLICQIFGHREPSLGVLLHWECSRCHKLLPPPALNPSHYTRGYILGTDTTGKAPQQWIECLDCKRKSYHPKDIEHRYCGCCHKFHPPVSEEK